jgi:hypothetical protein
MIDYMAIAHEVNRYAVSKKGFSSLPGSFPESPGHAYKELPCDPDTGARSAAIMVDSLLPGYLIEIDGEAHLCISMSGDPNTLPTNENGWVRFKVADKYDSATEELNILIQNDSDLQKVLAIATSRM